MTREETMSVIAKGVNPDSVCPLIDDIGRQAAYGFDLAREYAFEHDEDEILLDLMMRLYIDDKYMEAVDMLTITFALIGADQMYTKMALVAASGRDDIYELFLDSFIDHSERCQSHFDSVIAEVLEN